MSAPEIIASRYRVVRELGRGGMGVVYIVEHLGTGDHVALKLLYGQAATDAQSITRFKREARASARIKSDHVVKVFDADVAPELDDAPFLVMELLDGSDLDQLIEYQGKLPPAQVVEYLGQASIALDKSHAAGIVHRDLKPENLFVHHREDGSEIIKILDFGISKIVGGDTGGDMAGAGMTSTGAVMGTPLYMAPEQARGLVSEIGPATDIWAMGLIGLYLLTGEIYWRANTIAELMVAILSEPMYAPTQRWPFLPPTIDAWFARSCSRTPAERFASVGEQISALANALGFQFTASSQSGSSSYAGRPSAASIPQGYHPTPTGARTTAAVAAGTAPTVERRRSRAPLWIGLGGFLLVGIAGAAAFVLHSRAAGPSADAATSANTTPIAAASAPAEAPASAEPAPPAAPASAAAPTANVAPAPTKPDAVAPHTATTPPSRHVAVRRAPAPAKPKPKVAKAHATAHATTHVAAKKPAATTYDPAAP